MTQYAVRNLNGDMLGNEKIEDLLHRAQIAFNALSDEDKEKHMAAQRKSWVDGEMAIQRLERVKALSDRVPMDAEYNLARLEGQVARLERISNSVGITLEVEDMLKEIVQKSKGFIASIRNAIDPRRIDVV